MKFILNAGAALLLLTLTLSGYTQSAVHFQKQGEHRFDFLWSAYTTLFDAQGRDYVYAACNELGVVSFDISDPSNPFPIDTLRKAADLNNRNATNLIQFNGKIFASLGGFQSIGASPTGLAIIDPTDPENLVITDLWDTAYYDQGSAIVVTDGDYAYLGAMDSGVIVLDVMDQSNIKFVSHFMPDPDFPSPPGLFSQPNARGMLLSGNDLYVCMDSKGFRRIDVTDKMNLTEEDKYVHWIIENDAQPAYNNVVIVGNYAYLAVDYCGVDIVDISQDPMVHVGWWNPWDCNQTNWNGRDGHTNQIVVVGDSLLFISGGDSDVLVLDIDDPINPILIGQFSMHGDSSATWGLDVKGDMVVTANVNNSVVKQPYFSDWGGIQLLKWSMDSITNDGLESNFQQNLFVYPNPAGDFVYVNNGIEDFVSGKVLIYSITGRLLDNQSVMTNFNGRIELSGLKAGIYLIKVQNDSFDQFFKLVKN